MTARHERGIGALAAPLRAGQSLLGPPTSLIDTSEILWDTLSRHRRPDAPPLPSRDLER